MAGLPHDPEDIRQGGKGKTLQGEITPPRDLLNSSLHFAIVSIGFIMGLHIAVLLTGLLAGPEAIAHVRIAARVAEIAGVIRTIAVQQYRPMFAEAHGKGDKALLQKHATSLAIIFCASGVPIFIGLWIFAEPSWCAGGRE